MNTSTEPTNRTAFGFWKVLAIIAVALIALAMLGPIIKGLIWIGFIGLAVYGAIALYRISRSGNGPKPPATF
ncbi:hypothetical protein GYA93_07715 [Gordonia desulfuricans]|uniref:DUF4175 domain-containing protein n=1 Tax=Gordonia desulfuricans TaxID=89051 RepID=A0A7K3LMJ2_9ACTN|nr:MULTISPECIES: hypothetical protein [Gordonia]EMP12365.2 hypothetical protein ISGA_3001 [Gordonia sp. NB41Y]NDK89470.1 hypothetical protein [Gordonia desulfuricans]WLP89842.1 hypothetical protein Q9K23_20205 [Gordonia sp. NB41Y]